MLTPLASIGEQFEKLEAVSYCPKGNWVAVAGEARERGPKDEYGAVALWSPANGTSKVLIVTRGVAQSIAFSPGGKYLLVGTRRWNGPAQARLIDVTTGRDALPSKENFKVYLRGLGHVDADVRSVAISRRGNRLAIGDGGGRVRVWDAGRAEPTHTISDVTDVQAICFSPDGTRLVVVGHYHTRDAYGEFGFGTYGYGTIVIAGIDDGTKSTREVGWTNRVTAVAFSHDGTELLIGTENRKLCYFEMATLSQTNRLERGYDGCLDMGDDGCPVAPVTGAALHPNGKWVIGVGGGCTGKVTDAPGRIRIWDRSTGSKAFSLDVKSCVTGLALSPDGTRLVTTHRDGSASVWGIES